MIDRRDDDDTQYHDHGNPKVIEQILRLAVSDFMDVFTLGDREKSLEAAKDIPRSCTAIFQGKDEQFLPVKGWDEYKKISVKYRNQIVCE